MQFKTVVTRYLVQQVDAQGNAPVSEGFFKTRKAAMDSITPEWSAVIVTLRATEEDIEDVQ